MLLRLGKILFLITAPLLCFSQAPYKNEAGRYAITPLPNWTASASGNVTNVYAPDEETMDSWSERLEISIGEANDVNLDDAFSYYITKEFPSTYGKFTVLKQGQETINGLKARWAVFAFTGTGSIAGAGSTGDSSVSATLQTVFYLIEKNNSLYFMTGVTEKSYFYKYEPSFLTIIRSFRLYD